MPRQKPNFVADFSYGIIIKHAKYDILNTNPGWNLEELK